LPKNVILTSIKKAEGEENAIVITMYESNGINSDVALTLQFLPKNIVESNFLEVSGKTIKNDHAAVKFSIGKNQTKVIKVYF
jgi:alpha-mannosidase